jgi:signal transduction histidine kinase
MNILLVEDNAGDARLIREALRSATGFAFELEHVENLTDAVGAMARRRFDVVLLDLSLPDSFGLDTVRRVASADPSLPIVVMTGLDDESVAAEAVRAGAQDYLPKGDLNGSLLARAMRYAVDRKRTEVEREGLAQALAEKNEELEQTVYTVSHDLRSPLVTVDGFAGELGLLLEELAAKLNGMALSESDRTGVNQLLEDVPEAIGFIRSGTKKMSALLDSLLQLSRLGRVTLEIQTLDMNLLLAQVTSALQFGITQAGARVEVSPLPACRGDAAQVDRIFSNLIGNAVKYRQPDRTLEIKVTGRTTNVERRTSNDARRTTHDGLVVYCVEDNGMGIPPEFREKAFMLFQRVHPESGQGEGLGLAIVRRIAERLGGRVWLESELGKGSRFFVELPKA